MNKKYIPYGHQYIDKDDISAVIKVLKSNWLTQGPNIELFENKLAKYCGAKYAVLVSSGTAALHIACLALGINKGDEGITSPITFAASVNCILYCGGKPRFADIDIDTGNININEIEKILNKKTKVIIPVHFAGHPCDMAEIYKIAQKNGISIIEDAAHALGAKYSYNGNWIKVGSCTHSDMTILSFHPVKHITTGEGGAVLTNNKTLYEKLILLRNHGISRTNLINNLEGQWYYEMQELGFNYRITDIQSALGISQLKKIDRFISKRRNIVEIYNKHFQNNPFFDIPIEKKWAFSSYHLYAIRIKPEFIKFKKRIFSILREKGIGVQVHYIPVYLHPYYQRLSYSKGLCKNAEKFYNSEISLPLYPKMKDSDIDFVVKTVLNTFKMFV